MTKILIFIYIVFAFNKQELASCEDRTHDLQIMRLNALPTALTRLLFWQIY